MVLRMERPQPSSLSRKHIHCQTAQRGNAPARMMDGNSEIESNSVRENVQLFFRSIFKFKSISLRPSKLEIVRVEDLAPSFSACTS